LAHLRPRRLIVAARLGPRRLIAALALSAGLLPAVAPAARAETPAVPIAQTGTVAASLPQFVGAPANPLGFYAPDPPRHPFMAANGTSEIHDDAYQTDTYQASGPLGVNPQVLSTEVNGVCGSLTFDRQGRVVTVCVSLDGPTLYMFDPHTLDTLASMMLPARPPGSSGTNPFQDFTGGGYFYLDNQGRVVVATTTKHLYVIAETASPGFTLQHDYDLSGVIPSADKVTSALPDWSGRIWVESLGGVLVTIDPATGAMHSLALNEETENSFAVDETGGVFVVSIKALYRFDAAADGTPRVSWREVYPNSGIHKPGQVDAGSGTTPTLQGPYVTITDNADPLDIVVYRRARNLGGQPRQVCVQPIFAAGAGADENSIIGAGNTMIAENNYGYTGPTVTENGGVTSPGIVRVDISPDGSGCHVVWANNTERVPTAVSKVSLAAGLLYTYTKDDTSSSDPWYFTTLDFRTGRVVYRQLAGTGLGFNNNYAPVTIGPDGSAYIGVIGGLVEIRDTTPPNVPLATPPSTNRPHATGPRLHVRHLRNHRIRVSITGAVMGVRQVTYRLGATRRTTRRAPFAVTLSLTRLTRGRRYALRATLTRSRGRPVRLTARVTA
jgi:hypothetical protein